MHTIRIIRGALTSLLGIIFIGAGISLEVSEPWLYILGVVFIGWGAWDIYKEVRDSAKGSDVSGMAKQREEIMQRLEKKD